MAFVKKYLFSFSIILNIFLCVVLYANHVNNDPASTPKEEKAYWLGRDDIFNVLPSKEGGIVFLGDSHIENFELSEFFGRTDVLNRGIVGDSVASVQKRLNQVINLKPRSLFLEMGVNDIASGYSIDYIMPKYEEILKTVHTRVPDCKIFVMSVLPTSVEKKKLPHYCNAKVNKKIIELNDKLQSLCMHNKFTYVDFHKEIYDGAGLANDLTVDGVHLSGKAYQAWYDVLKPYIN